MVYFKYDVDTRLDLPNNLYEYKEVCQSPRKPKETHPTEPNQSTLIFSIFSPNLSSNTMVLLISNPMTTCDTLGC
jgi:hypothetical protein